MKSVHLIVGLILTSTVILLSCSSESRRKTVTYAELKSICESGEKKINESIYQCTKRINNTKQND